MNSYCRGDEHKQAGRHAHEGLNRNVSFFALAAANYSSLLTDTYCDIFEHAYDYMCMWNKIFRVGPKKNLFWGVFEGVLIKGDIALHKLLPCCNA